MTASPGDASVQDLEHRVRECVEELARRRDPQAFAALLQLSELVGVSLGEAARSLAAASSWSQVADRSGTTKQAAWQRWR